MTADDYTAIWQQQDAITTIVNANGFGIWDLHIANGGFHLELDAHLDDEQISDFCPQLPLTADYSGEGGHGTIIEMYNN